MGFLNVGKDFILQLVHFFLQEKFFETRKKEILVLVLLLVTFTFNGFLEVFKLLIEEIIK